jgi:ElaB/YqjD/DUF883 family membrane-anchored ribosome-binding protein
MSENTIQEKLRLIREGFIEESMTIKDFDTLFTESIIIDINNISESISEVLFETTVGGDAAKNRLKQLIDWLIKKIRQFLDYIEKKTNELFKEKPPRTKYTELDGKEVQIYTSAINGNFNLKAMIAHLRAGLTDAKADEVYEKAEGIKYLEDTIYKEILKVDKEELATDLIGHLKDYTYSDVDYTPKILAAIETAREEQQELSKLLRIISDNLQKLYKEITGNTDDELAKILPRRFDYYSHLNSIMFTVESLIMNYLTNLIKLPVRHGV